MKLSMLLQLLILLTVANQGASTPDCFCELKNLEKPFPHDELRTVEDSASKCSDKYTQQKIQDIDILLLALENRMPQLEAMVAELEKEDDGDLYGAISLHLIENEQAEILKFIQQLSNTTEENQLLNTDTEQKLQKMKEEMQNLQAYDSMQVLKREQANMDLKRDLDQCRHPIPQPTQPPQSNCPLGHMVNVTGPRVNTPAPKSGSTIYTYGAWGRDPKPEAGKESWYWLVMLTTSNVFANFVRRYSSLSGLIVGASHPGIVQISSSNPATNTIQGPNAVLYGEALYYGCYNYYAICRFNLPDRSITSVQLPKGTRFNSQSNFCHIGQCYSYTDLDLATDESGVWVIYTTSENFGNLVVSKVEPGKQPTLGQTWHTSLYKQAVTNTFVACGMLYATRYVSATTEEIFYAFDTTTGVERYDVGIYIQKMSVNIMSLNYSPVDHMLYVYSDGKMVSYQVEFE